ncbi:hypothetical protein B0A52_02173 [Exophiala mesophila]|uniref:UDP-galactose transporter homolog 1 n=1 Tax=Exophiala mesophila TaxID=212818 RepID=A0A438NBR6_EXOME|nr:hypothetical protein B0A52_02173 [Exophiala mesophila]
MARRKQATPTQKTHAGGNMRRLSEEPQPHTNHINGSTMSLDKSQGSHARNLNQPPQAGVLALIVCVGGIYASFLTWGLLQERITTTAYAFDHTAQPVLEYFRFPIFLNTVQALFAFTSGSAYLVYKTRSFQILPSASALGPFFLITFTTTLASPFGYASLAHVDYLTFVLAKSCKLLPVMALHITLFRKRYPLSKYLIVLAVTGGVATFTLYHPPKSDKPNTSISQSSSTYGLVLLAINLLFDGLTNTVQDHIFTSPLRYGKTTGPQMMVVLNLLSLILMSAYLVTAPFVPLTLVPSFLQPSQTHELSTALSFLSRHPTVFYDVLGFSACGAIGQLFIYATLERFSSLLLVTVTVTRKMLTMLLSVVWFGKSLSHGQWLGVTLVFGGVAAEGWLARVEKMEKEKRKKIR